eukprot:2107359-Ditylum_brightwellii.AAC.1
MDHLLFGIFEALTTATMNIGPTAFSKNPKAITSPFPVQIHTHVSLECPLLEDTDPVLNDILYPCIGGQIRPLKHTQAEAVARLLASQCDALQYMMEYQSGVELGFRNVVHLPIALPLHKINVLGRNDINDAGGSA